MSGTPQESGIDPDALERTLAPLAHGEEARKVLQDALEPLRPKSQRQEFLNRHMLRPVIRYEDVRERFEPPLEPFFALQGDVVQTENAYILGQRRTAHDVYGSPLYVVATSTCDLVSRDRHPTTLPHEEPTFMLLQVLPRRPSDPTIDERDLKQELSELTVFRRSRSFYLPPLHDQEGVLYNVVLLEAHALASLKDLPLMQRRASMSVLGWRVFGALFRTLQIREADGEVNLRRVPPSP